MKNKFIKKFFVLGLVILNLIGVIGKGVYAGGGSGYDPYQDNTNPIVIIKSKEFNEFKNSLDPFWFNRSCMLPFHLRNEEIGESYYGLSDEDFQKIRTYLYDCIMDYFKDIRLKIKDDDDFIRLKNVLMRYFRRSIIATSSDIYIKDKIDITDSFCTLIFNAYMKIILKANSMDELYVYFKSVDLLDSSLKYIGKPMAMFFPHDSHNDCLVRRSPTYMQEPPKKAVLYEDVLRVVENHFCNIPRHQNLF